MTEPTKERCLYLADVIEKHPFTLGMQLTKILAFTEHDCNQIIAALRLAANLPSEEELKTLVFRYTGDHQYPDYSGAAVAILERIRSVK